MARSGSVAAHCSNQQQWCAAQGACSQVTYPAASCARLKSSGSSVLIAASLAILNSRPPMCCAVLRCALLSAPLCSALRCSALRCAILCCAAPRVLVPNKTIEIRLDKLDDAYGSPGLEDIERFSRGLAQVRHNQKSTRCRHTLHCARATASLMPAC